MLGHSFFSLSAKASFTRTVNLTVILPRLKEVGTHYINEQERIPVGCIPTGL